MGQGEVKRYFVIGDIHGCLGHLEAMMEHLSSIIEPEEDALVFIGDYVDRGPDPKGVVEKILQIREQYPHVICIMGNHEDMFLTWATTGRDLDLYLYNGGGVTIRSYQQEGGFHLPPSHLSFLKSLHLYYETDRYIFVHAGLRPGVPLAEQDRFDLLWIRDEFIRAKLDLGKVVVFGHTPFRRPLVMEDKIGIDTGAVFGGPLTCVELPTLEFHFAYGAGEPSFGLL